MRLLFAGLAAVCLVTNAHAMDEQRKNEIIVVYNFTANLYAKVVGMFSDLEDRSISVSRAEEKIEEWAKDYREQTALVPSETRKMCELMVEMLKAAKAAADDYDPVNRRTKDALAALDEAKDKFMRELKDVKYQVQ